MKLTCPYFKDGHTIPTMFTGDGEDISPPLQWQDAPGQTKSFAMIVEDPDAPSGLFTHWVIYNIPPIINAFDREVPHGAHYGENILQGMNDFGKMGYGGPKPPDGEHRYIFRLFALDTVLEQGPGLKRQALLDAIGGHILMEAQLTGLYATQMEDNEGAETPDEDDAYDLAVRSGPQVDMPPASDPRTRPNL